MNNSTKPTQVDTLDCPLREQWVSFRLVDEHGEGKPYAGLAYQLHDNQGQKYAGTLDSDGFAKVQNFYCGAVVLNLSTLDAGNLDPWYKELTIRKSFQLPLTALQVAAEQSPTGPRHADGKTYLAEARAQREQARFLRVEVSDFADAIKHLPTSNKDWWPRPSATLKQSAGLAAQELGIALTPKLHHVLEVKALRAYSPLLSREKAFCAVNAYHLAVMTAFVYAPFSDVKKANESYVSRPPPYPRAGSIGHVLHEQLARLIKPTQFNDARYPLLYEEVPYSKRLEVVPYDPERYKAEATAGWDNPEKVHFLYDEASETQAFITHSDKVMLISVRGTQELADIGRDLDARQVPYQEGVGQAHRGFYEAFLAAKAFVERYMDAFYTEEQTLIVCGHSLGGAIALLLAEWLRRLPSAPNVMLYTFGSPRAGDSAFAQGAQALTHHRLVNHNDPVPGVPATWMDAEWKLALPGTVMLLSALGNPLLGVTLLLAGLLNLKGDPYEHHGEQRHFMPRKEGAGSEAAILWQPGCASVTENACAKYTADIALDGDMPQRKGLPAPSEHSSDSGYSRAALTTLVRWIASVEQRDGVLLTPEETQSIYPQLQRLNTQLHDWHPQGSFQNFEHNAHNSTNHRLQKKTTIELLQLYNHGLTEITQLRDEQLKRLTQAQQRLLEQTKRVVNKQSIFGDLSQRPDLAALVAEWRKLKDIHNAELLASVQSSNQRALA
jgi:hypothetical protein